MKMKETEIQKQMLADIVKKLPVYKELGVEVSSSKIKLERQISKYLRKSVIYILRLVPLPPFLLRNTRESFSTFYYKILYAFLYT